MLKQFSFLKNSSCTLNFFVSNRYDCFREYLVQYNRENKIFGKDDTPLWELSHLSLSYKNIIEIDNLQGLDRLQRLQLDNNIICQIKGLDHLVNLEWLDLSFNMIEKIEGLDKLTKLTDLSLFSNSIVTVSGLENLKNLNVLSLGSNKIPDYAVAIKYLYDLRLKKLQVLKMADNPFYKTKEAEYRLFSIAFLKTLKYLDYELIDEETRSNATEKHREEFNEQESLKNQDGANADELERSADPALKNAKIDCTVGMIARIIKNDKESSALSHLPKFLETLQPHDANIEENTAKFQGEMKNRNKEKMNTIAFCEQVLRNAEKQAEQESIVLIDKFNTLRKHKFRRLFAIKEGEHFDYNSFKKEMAKEIETLEDDLMAVELKLQEQLQVATTDFQERVKRVLEEMKNKTNVYIQEVNQEMELFSVSLKAYALQEVERIGNMGDDGDQEPMTDEFVLLMDDADYLNSQLEGSKENIELRVNDIESQIIKDLTNDWKATEQRITEDQHHRNRTIVQEIIKTCDKFKKEISKHSFIEN